ncbi:MAG: 1-acyl-sn-glycerol-3-phosphate acyltransferase [Chloroflexi bacterium CG_4_10_14_0_8_um_filter_57_5]|nr:MAG: 1-acyl-sn-glycerol-3-phosphate acyltransferase [Anaerolineae bacterium CG06_land_8_20_14_3_00_57_67]PIW19946.1 MAG: 1-acyl-sn-glycerol-3-phosphate acyltransferase [Anaerolineae bacterium CG17_big_fil_post_rev_8_21_14_2_50_57_27]PIZ25976.1 MAG: 1-acyl-sn-glycerol-3-phosphate acyltransferase [Chloroflexi bacterium CG_4_10_14_0_8_um_filter_57_5]PJH75544.1 MAG: 1-acyl-sn-glycerol-3-phosphate acyltransferase [Anaerolineae bacterium CG_4_9_14_0_8_um_filter_58_9]
MASLAQVPARGPLILVTNHIGSLEVPLLFAHLQPRPVTGFAKIETWDDPFMGWLFDLWGAIPIRRGEADVDALRKGFTALEQGCILAVAPEGTRSRHGRLLRARPGVAMIALRSGVMLLPLAHWGGENFSGNLKRLKRTDFHVKVGQPFRLQVEEKVTRQVRQQVADEIMFQIAALMPEAYRGEYVMMDKSTAKYLRFAVGD